MPLRVLIAPDKFKGTLTAQEAAQAIASGWRRVRPKDYLELLPISDGGDGFGELMGSLLECRTQTIRTVDAAHRPCTARWWWEPKSCTAIIEAAQANGLAQLPVGKFHPFDLDTFGLGKLIQAAAAKGARRFLVGIGGSATNDGGFGMARALGWKFFAKDGALIDEWTGLNKLERIEPPTQRLQFDYISVAVDVQNRLLGPKGATRVYGPQKGLRPKDFAHAERCLARLAAISRKQFHRAFASSPGSGAAGGLGFGFTAFTGAKLEPGFELLAQKTNLDKQLMLADLVITGEGAIDHSTLMGKGAGEIARRCRTLRTPCMALAGTIKATAQHQRLFEKLYALTDLTSAKNARSNPKRWLKLLAEKAARQFSAENL